MRRPNLGMSIVCLASTLLFPAAVRPETPPPVEKEVTMEALPAPVQRTARAQSEGAVVGSITEEVVDGKTVYEVATKVKGRVRDVIIGADGTLLVVENQVDMKALPRAVQTTFKKNTGKGRIVLVESVTLGDSLAYYEAHVRTGKRESEIKVQLDGELIPAEVKK